MNIRTTLKYQRVIFIVSALVLFQPYNANASEFDELATTQRLLDQVQLSHYRARIVTAKSDPNNRRSNQFDYKRANKDLNTMRAGIDR